MHGSQPNLLLCMLLFYFLTNSQKYRLHFSYVFSRDGRIFQLHSSSKNIHRLSCDLTESTPLPCLISLRLGQHLLFHYLTVKTKVVQLECVSYYTVHSGTIGLVLRNVMKICRESCSTGIKVQIKEEMHNILYNTNVWIQD